MAEPLTFKFVFQDDGGGGAPQAAPQAAPPEATPGAAQRANPKPPDEEPPQPRRPPASTTSPAPPAAPSHQPADEDDSGTTPTPRSTRAPRRQQPDIDAQPSQRQPRPPREPSPTERRPQPGDAERLARDLMGHLSSLPGLGKGIGTLGAILGPLLRARQQIAAVRERAAVEESPSPRRPAPPAAPEADIPLPTPRPPEAEEPSKPGDVRNPTPGAAAAALERLIGALGPLPESTRELTETLKPLTSLGYKIGELKDAVAKMREREASLAAGSTPVAKPAPRPPAATAPTATSTKPRPTPSTPSSPAPSPRPPAPGPATLTPRDLPPASAPAPGAASAAAAAPIEAEGGGAIAAGAAGGPAGLIAGIAIVATIGAASKAFGALVGTVQKVDHTFVELSGRLAPFNGRLAFAQAQAATRQTLLDIERAGRLGGDLAEFTDERSRLSREFQRIQTDIESAILPAINAAAGKLGDILEEGRQTLGASVDFLGGLMEGMSASEAITAAATKALQKAGDQAEADRKAKEAMDVANIFFGNGDKSLSIGGVDYGSAADWAEFVPQATPRPNRNGRAFGGI